MKPTEEQIKEFWEWCGLVWVGDWEDKAGVEPEHWLSPSGEHIHDLALDLNNLFKYAVPKLHSFSLYSYGEYCKAAVSSTINGEYMAEDPALALFWAIYKVIKCQ